MARALKCDRCGQFFDLLKSSRKYQIHDMDRGNFNRTVDLCPDCYDFFLNFLEEDREMFKALDEIKNKDLIGSGELYPGEFGSRHYDFEDCDNIKGERVIKCREDSE